MADISLRDYLAKLNTLLEREANSEAIHHARHILQYFPKNVAAYRALGLALLATGSMNEAVDVFRRVLSVYPDDFIAHLNLGHAYTRARRPNEALWHYERAFERDPNNQTLMENLRRLYREHRQVEHAKIQLTAGAVARQYNRNGLYAQAIDTLKQALARTPERADLLLLLANVLWDSNRPVEAGEIALEVLRKLPDAADANRILAELWLREDRPSDAQRYLSRIEAVDPYLAASIARGGQQVAKEMFRLEELDYQRVAQRAVTQQNPDWLTELGGDDPFGAGSAADEGLLDFQDSSDDALVTEPPDDWLTSLEGLEEEAGSETKLVTRDAAQGKQTMSDDDFEALFGTAPVEDDLFNFEDSAEEAAVPADLPDDWLASIQIDDSPPASGGSTGFTDFLNQTDFSEAEPTASSESTGFTDFLNQTDFSTPESSASPASVGTPDDLDWLAMDEFETTTEDEPDPLAWLQGTEIELLDDHPSQSAAPINRGVLSTDEIAAASDHADPLEWLRDSDVEIVPDAPETRSRSLFDTDEPLTLQSPDEADPLAWLRDSDVEVVDDGGAKGLFDTDGLDVPEQSPDEADPLAWLQGYEVEVSDDLPPRAARSTASPAPEPAPADSSLDWLSDQGLLDEMLNIEQLSDTGEMARIDTGMLQAAEDTASIWEEQPEATAEDDLFGDTGVAVDQPVEAGADDFEQLQDWQDAMPENQDNEKSDWFQSSQQDDFDWLDANEDEKISADTGFDWLNEAGISEQPVSQPPSALASAESEDEATLDWMSEFSGEEVELPAAQGEGFDWLDETEKDAAEALTGSMPDWLANVGPTEQAAPPTPASSDSLDWLDSPEDANQETPTLASAPDWLADVGPTEPAAAALGDDQRDEEQSSEPVSLFEETDDWLNSLDAVETEQQKADAVETESPVLSGGTDDWLSGFDAESEAEADAEPASELDWLSAYDAAEAAQAEEETPLEAVGFSTTEDWLSSLDAEQSAAELHSEEDDYETAPVGEWLASLEAEDEEEDDQPAIAASESWLSELDVESEEDDDQPAVAASESWLSELDVESEEDDQPAVAASESWLSELDVESEAEAQPDEAPQFASAVGDDWLSNLEDDDQAAETQPAPPSFATGNTDWLNALDQEAASSDEEQSADQPLFASSDDWLSAYDDHEKEEEELAPAEAAFASAEDWLSELQAADDAEDEEDEIEALAAEDADWLTGITVGEAAPDTDDWLSKFEEPSVVGQPDWLAQLDVEDETAEPEESQPATTADDQSWLSEFGVQEDQTAESEVQPAASGVMPDWLSALQSEEEEPRDDADDWLEEEDDEEEFAAALPANEDWLSGIGTQQDNELQDDLLPEETGAQYDWLDELNDQPATASTSSAHSADAGDDYEEELEITGASNAPDWLNAMVPGLDVDYQAPEDAPIEKEYLEQAPAHRTRSVTVEASTRDFDWVNDIVEAETHPADDDRVPVPPAAPRRRFTFSRLPAWLRGNDNTVSAVDAPVRAAAPVFDDDLPNWLSEADELMDDTTEIDDADLPDWLK